MRFPTLGALRIAGDTRAAIATCGAEVEPSDAFSLAGEEVESPGDGGHGENTKRGNPKRDQSHSHLGIWVSKQRVPPEQCVL